MYAKYLLTFIADLSLPKHPSWLLRVEKSLSDYFMRLSQSKTMLSTSVIFRYILCIYTWVSSRMWGWKVDLSFTADCFLLSSTIFIRSLLHVAVTGTLDMHQQCWAGFGILALIVCLSWLCTVDYYIFNINWPSTIM